VKYLRRTERNECGDGAEDHKKEVRMEKRQSSWPGTVLDGTVTSSLMENLVALARLPLPPETCV